MTKNVTLKLDDGLLRQARHLAVASEKSLSQWVTDLIVQALSSDGAYARSRRRALRRLEKGFKLGDPLSREEVHER